MQKLTANLGNKIEDLTIQIEKIEDAHKKKMHEYQLLIENLRERIKEKDKTIQELSSQSE